MADSEKIKIISILEEIKKHESFFQNPLQNQINNGFLIEYNLMENFIKKISFEELKNLSSIQFTRLKENLDFNKINNYIISKKFESKQDLVSELRNEKKYYIILDTLWKKICKDENKNEKGIIFYFQDNKINLKFNNNEVISFYNNNGIIEESNMIQSTIYRNNKRPQNQRKNPNTRYIQRYFIDSKEQYKNIKFSISIDKQYKNEYSCLNCKSDIEFKSIKYDKEKNEELIIYNCTGKCGTKIVSIKDFIDQCFNNTYLNEKCILCGKIQKNEYFKSNNFIYCIYCKNIYCGDCMKKNNNFCLHNKFIYIYEIRKKCFIHGEQISYYCYDDKKPLCKECLNNEHSNHNKAYMDQSILSKEEYKLFGHILEYIKNFNNISVTDSIQKQLKEIEEREKNFCNEFILKKEKKEIELEEVFHSKLKNLSNDIIEEISSSIHKLKKEKIEIETLNIFFNNLQKIQNDYLEKISKIEKE